MTFTKQLIYKLTLTKWGGFVFQRLRHSSWIPDLKILKLIKRFSNPTLTHAAAWYPSLVENMPRK